MRVFLAGATGAIGKQLVPRLVAAGHEVLGTTRSESKRRAVEELGAKAVVVDALDADQVGDAIVEAKPEVIIHELTAIGSFDIRNFDRSFALTNRLRIDGTDNLLAAGRAVGVKRFIAQSYTAWPYARSGGPVKDEEDPLDPTPARNMRESLNAIRHVETAVTGADWTEGIALRYGGSMVLARRCIPAVSSGSRSASGSSRSSVTAAESGPSSISLMPPRRPPGQVGVLMMTEIRGASNAKAKRELGWQPRHPSWREGFGS